MYNTLYLWENDLWKSASLKWVDHIVSHDTHTHVDIILNDIVLHEHCLWRSIWGILYINMPQRWLEAKPICRHKVLLDLKRGRSWKVSKKKISARSPFIYCRSHIEYVCCRDTIKVDVGVVDISKKSDIRWVTSTSVDQTASLKGIITIKLRKLIDYLYGTWQKCNSDVILGSVISNRLRDCREYKECTKLNFWERSLWVYQKDALQHMRFAEQSLRS